MEDSRPTESFITFYPGCMVNSSFNHVMYCCILIINLLLQRVGGEGAAVDWSH